jgi:hypothetical protein
MHVWAGLWRSIMRDMCVTHFIGLTNASGICTTPCSLWPRPGCCNLHATYMARRHVVAFIHLYFDQVKVIDLKARSHRPTRFNSTKRFCRVESGLVYVGHSMWSSLKDKSNLLQTVLKFIDDTFIDLWRWVRITWNIFVRIVQLLL